MRILLLFSLAFLTVPAWASTLYTATKMGTGLPSGAVFEAQGINDSGQVAGLVAYNPPPSNWPYAAFVYSGRTMTNLGTLPGYPSASASAINNSGQVAGTAVDSYGNPQEAILYSGGLTIPLGTLGGAHSATTDLNDSGQVVGWALDSSGNLRAFLYSGGTMTNLGTLGSYTNSSAVAINAGGQVPAI